MRGEELIALLGVTFGAVVVLFPLARALADRIRSRPLDAGLREEIQVLREDIIAEIQQTRREIGEMGERIDFAERLLAKRVER
jgi:hypothetical protein